jgi:hypothetical protein
VIHRNCESVDQKRRKEKNPAEQETEDERENVDDERENAERLSIPIVPSLKNLQSHTPRAQTLRTQTMMRRCQIHRPMKNTPAIVLRQANDL